MSGFEILTETSLSSIVEKLLTPEFCTFLTDTVVQFDEQIREVFVTERQKRQLDFVSYGHSRLGFPSETATIRANPIWKVVPPPKCLERPMIDVGDIDPSNRRQFLNALHSKASGIQVDFDDGFCPNWNNVLIGHMNVYKLCRNYYHRGSPKLKLRPRSWNMIEDNILVNGSPVHGALFDFLLHIFHNGSFLEQQDGNVLFYLPKLESAREASIWSLLFHWAELHLNLAKSTIRAIVLIESISATFEMEEILYELRDHCAGLNCGVWDYSASFITRFGCLHSSELFPDRTRRGALSTGGMFAGVGGPKDLLIIDLIKNKKGDFRCGADGALVYDPNLSQVLIDLFSRPCDSLSAALTITDELQLKQNLLCFPKDGCPLFEGFCRNVEVTFHFILAWLKGRGHFILRNQIEDSATAEISRTQVWQQLRRSACFRIFEEDFRNNSTVGDLSSRVLNRVGTNTNFLVANGKLLKITLDEVMGRMSQDDNLVVVDEVTKSAFLGSSSHSVTTSLDSVSLSTTFLETTDLERSHSDSDVNRVIPSSPTPSLSTTGMIIEISEVSNMAYNLTIELLTSYQCPLFITTWLQQRGVLRAEVRNRPSKL